MIEVFKLTKPKNRFVPSISFLKKGDVFRTDRMGKLPWSRWFIALENPRRVEPRLYFVEYYKGKAYNLRSDFWSW